MISNEPIDVWFMDERNFDIFVGGNRHPKVDDTNVGIYEAKINFKAPRKGLWFVVMENPSKTSAKVKVNIYFLRKKARK